MRQRAARGADDFAAIPRDKAENGVERAGDIDHAGENQIARRTREVKGSRCACRVDTAIGGAAVIQVGFSILL